MTLMTLCALVPPLCRMTADEAVQRALQALHGVPLNDHTIAPLLNAMQRYPQDYQTMMNLLSAESHGQRFSPEVLALFQLCTQCSPTELLQVLTRCTVAPSAEALALLVGEHRREQAMARYALQLLWRIHGDDTLPDALTLFPEPAQAACSTKATAERILRRLKGGTQHD